MKSYLELMWEIWTKGSFSDDRTGVGTRSLFGPQLNFDLREGFPLLTTKKLHTRSIFTELEWFLKGRTDNQWLNDRGVTIWDEWATEEQCARFGRKAGDLGPIYGQQWRRFGERPGFAGVDQLERLVHDIRTNPNSRRMIVTGWDPVTADDVALPPCHTMFQVYVRNRRLSLKLYQRSADYFLGVPFNIASYALLTELLAHVCGLQAERFIHTFGDVHLYLNHAEQVPRQLARMPRPLPRIVLDPGLRGRGMAGIEDFTADSVEVQGYDPHPGIKAPVAV